MNTIGIFGGVRVDGSRVRPGESIFAFSLFGSVRVDFSQVDELKQEVDVTAISIFGGVHVGVPGDFPVRLSGFSLFGSHRLEGDIPFEEDQAAIAVKGYSIFGGVHVAEDRD